MSELKTIHSVKKINRTVITSLVIILGLVALLLGIGLSISLGAKDINLIDVSSSIFAGKQGLNSEIIRDIIMPRAISAALVGPDYLFIIPCSIVVGAALLVYSDITLDTSIYNFNHL
jgi:ABC-type Fe3+-siderophore transport system permease subunit